ncbi:hypothetical protein WMF18_20885 [Sorangium sp. So ce315]|uniref:hypothetical protein n=1 Tax=Sorangium sp. So ce315 TaxID=3133299 RepID=UPI003F648035
MKRPLLVPIAFPIVLSAACAGAPTPRRDPGAPLPAAARPPGVEPARAAAQSADARPVPAPEGLSSVMRIADSPRTWGDMTQLLAGTPFGMLLIGQEPEALLETALGPALVDVVDLGKPIDVAVLGTADPRLVMSLSVPEREMSRVHDRFVLEERRGMLRVKGVREGARGLDEGALPRVCAFEPGDRSGGARLLCADDIEDIQATAPYLVEVVGREPLDADVRIEITGRAVVEAMESTPAADDDSHSGRMGRDLAEGLFRDLESVSLDVTSARPDVDVRVGLRFASRRSPLALAVAPATAQDAAPPPAFFRLPRDTALAFYTQGASRAELAPLREAVYRGLREDMIGEGYDAAGLERFVDGLGALTFTGGPLVIGSGGDRAAAEKALADYSGGEGAARARKVARRALQSWFLIAVEEPAQTWITGVKELIQIGDELDRQKARAEAAGKGGPPNGAASKDNEATDVVVARAPAALPAGTLHVEMRSRPLTKDAPPAHTSHLYVVPAGQRTWIGIGEDDATVVDRLRIATDPGRDERTLGAVPGLDALWQRGALAGGLFSLAGFMMLAASGDTPEELDEAAKEFDGLAKLPARGAIAMPLAITSEALGSGAARLDAHVRMSPAAARDVIALMMR